MKGKVEMQKVQKPFICALENVRVQVCICCMWLFEEALRARVCTDAAVLSFTVMYLSGCTRAHTYSLWSGQNI